MADESKTHLISGDILRDLKLLLEVPQRSRSENDIERLRQMIKSLPFVIDDIMSHSNGERLLNLFCVYMKYQIASKDERLYQIGEKGNEFYVILRGSVGLYTKKKIESTGEIDPYAVSRVRLIEEGCSFGELALLRDKPRIVFAKCEEETILLWLNKNRYKSILAQADVKYLTQEAGFLSSIPLQRQLSENIVRLLFLKPEVFCYQRDQVVFAEGDQVDDVYLVKTGEFGKLKNAKSNGGELESYWQHPTEEIRVKQQKSFMTKLPPTYTEIGIVTEKELVGEAEILRDEKNRQFTLKCVSHTGRLARIKRRDFDELLRQDDEGRRYLQERARKIEELEKITMERNCKGALFNHLFCYEDVYKQNRMQLKRPVFQHISSASQPLLLHDSNSIRTIPNLVQPTNLIAAQKLYSSPFSQLNNTLKSRELLKKQNSPLTRDLIVGIRGKKTKRCTFPPEQSRDKSFNKTLSERIECKNRFDRTETNSDSIDIDISKKFDRSIDKGSVIQKNEEKQIDYIQGVDKISTQTSPINYHSEDLQKKHLNLTLGKKIQEFNSGKNHVKKQSTMNSHTDPFIKMFQKRLEYNYFIQFGRVSSEQVKRHIPLQTAQQIDDNEGPVPSLSDLKALTDDYLLYTNKQELRKIDQRYLQAYTHIHHQSKKIKSTANCSEHSLGNLSSRTQVSTFGSDNVLHKASTFRATFAENHSCHSPPSSAIYKQSKSFQFTSPNRIAIDQGGETQQNILQLNNRLKLVGSTLNTKGGYSIQNSDMYAIENTTLAQSKSNSYLLQKKLENLQKNDSTSQKTKERLDLKPTQFFKVKSINLTSNKYSHASTLQENQFPLTSQLGRRSSKSMKTLSGLAFLETTKQKDISFQLTSEKNNTLIVRSPSNQQLLSDRYAKPKRVRIIKI